MKSKGWLRQAVHRVSERAHELRYGIATAGWVTLDALGYSKGDGRLEYSPIPYPTLKHLLSAAKPDPARDVFIDWGSGLGRAVLMATKFPYREVIGVEYSAEFCAAAQRNLERARISRVCGSARIVTADAREFAIPDDASVMYFYNPFRGELLTDVVRHIRDSWQANPRTITFLVANHSNFIEDTGSEDWLMLVSRWSEYPNIGCVVIRSKDPVAPGSAKDGIRP